MAGDELYDHRVDPQERNNLASEYPEVTAALRRELLSAMGRRKLKPRPERASLEILERLKQLGYLE